MSLRDAGLRVTALAGQLAKERACIEIHDAHAAQAAQDRDAQLDRVTSLRQAADVLQALEESGRAQGTLHAERLVTGAVRAVLGDDSMSLVIEWGASRGQGTAKLMMQTGEGDEAVRTDILDGHGGGVVDVVSFVLRLVAAACARPQLRKTMILDEPFKHLSRDHADDIGYLLRQLSEQLGWQFIICTHQQGITQHADRAWRLDLVDGRTQAVRLSIND